MLAASDAADGSSSVVDGRPGGIVAAIAVWVAGVSGDRRDFVSAALLRVAPGHGLAGARGFEYAADAGLVDFIHGAANGTADLSAENGADRRGGKPGVALADG